MAYSFRQSDTSLTKGLRRVADSQIGRALDEIDDDDLSRSELIHQLRKRCKKLRGLIRLVRPGFEDYSDENRTFRDAARLLSPVRDAAAMVETVERVKDRFSRQLAPNAFGEMYSNLKFRRIDLDADDIREKLVEIRKTFLDARERAGAWAVEGDDDDVIAGGLKKTFKRARKAMAKARETGDGDDFHEWRKRVKYHWYHARLLKRTWPDAMDAHRSLAKSLSDDLGDHHDLVVFGRLMDAEPLSENPTEISAFRGLIRERRRKLEMSAFSSGEKVLAEKPDQLAARWTQYWRAWRGED